MFLQRKLLLNKVATPPAFLCALFSPMKLKFGGAVSMRTAPLLLSSSQVSVKNIKLRLWLIIKSLIISDLPASDLIWRTARFNELTWDETGFMETGMRFARDSVQLCVVSSRGNLFLSPLTAMLIFSPLNTSGWADVNRRTFRLWSSSQKHDQTGAAQRVSERQADRGRWGDFPRR